jgi:hypothetical protein
MPPSSKADQCYNILCLVRFDPNEEGGGYSAHYAKYTYFRDQLLNYAVTPILGVDVLLMGLPLMGLPEEKEEKENGRYVYLDWAKPEDRQQFLKWMDGANAIFTWDSDALYASLRAIDRDSPPPPPPPTIAKKDDEKKNMSVLGKKILDKPDTVIRPFRSISPDPVLESFKKKESDAKDSKMPSLELIFTHERAIQFCQDAHPDNIKDDLETSMSYLESPLLQSVIEKPIKSFQNGYLTSERMIFWTFKTFAFFGDVNINGKKWIKIGVSEFFELQTPEWKVHFAVPSSSNKEDEKDEKQDLKGKALIQTLGKIFSVFYGGGSMTDVPSTTKKKKLKTSFHKIRVLTWQKWEKQVKECECKGGELHPDFITLRHTKLKGPSPLAFTSPSSKKPMQPQSISLADLEQDQQLIADVLAEIDV